MSLIYIYSSNINYEMIKNLEVNIKHLKKLAKSFVFAFPSEFFTEELNDIIKRCGIINKFNIENVSDFHITNCHNDRKDLILGFSVIFDRKNYLGYFDLKSSFQHVDEILTYKSILIFNCDFLLLRNIDEINYGNFECNTFLGENGGHFYHIIVNFTVDGLVKYLMSDTILMKNNKLKCIYEIVNGLHINNIYDYFYETPLNNNELNNYDDFHINLYYELNQKYNNTKRNNRNLTIYVYYHKEGFRKNETNFQHFLNYGLNINNMDYIIVLHSEYDLNLLPIKDNVEYIYEHNCQDFEAWYNILMEEEWYKYNNIFFINCSVLGPLNFDGSQNIIENWDIPYLNKMKDDDAICCSNIIQQMNNKHPSGSGPRCSSYIFCLKTSVIPLLLTKRIKIGLYYNSVFSTKSNKMDTILTGEFGLSKVLLEAGYKLTCLHPNISDRGELKMTLFMKNNWIDGENRACLPCYYNECMYIIGKQIDDKIIDYDNININSKGKCYSDFQYNWNNKEEYYKNFGYSEEPNFFKFSN